MICMENGFYPKDPLDAWKVESINEALNEMLTPFHAIVFNTALSDSEKQDQVKKLLKDKFPKFLAKLDARLKANPTSGRLVGETWTMADI